MRALDTERKIVYSESKRHLKCGVRYHKYVFKVIIFRGVTHSDVFRRIQENNYFGKL